ncbi:hypothetical protein ACHAXR_009459 [Thalassiosira sp. AJA248-18]
MISSLCSSISSRAPAAASRLNTTCRRKITKNATSSSPFSLPSQPKRPIPFPTNTLRPISHTPFIQEQITVNVPTMGDSITEGTIVEWCVPPGSHVREDDVLALIETDKVTVDIKAEQEGVLVKQLGEVEGIVEVGKALYVLDTDVKNAESPAVVESSNVHVSEVNASLDAEKMVVAEEPIAPSSSTARVPSIHFRGKDGWKELLTATEDSPAVAASPTTIVPASNKPNAPTSITQMPFNPMYGRPAITDEEMEALMLGGADEAPEVRSVVSETGMGGVAFVGGKVVTAGPRGVWLAE